MNEKQISAATRENGKRQMQTIVERRAKEALAKARKSQRIALEESSFKMNIRGLDRTCFKRVCKCGKEFAVTLGDLNRGRGRSCSPRCNLSTSPMHNRGTNHPNYNGGDTARKRKYRDRHPQKVHCRNMTRAAVGLGWIEKEPCAICGDSNSQCHHLDYSQPFLVLWLCRKHHLELHANEALLRATGKWKE